MREWKEPALPQQVISGLAELLSSRGDVCQHLGNGPGGIAAPALSDRDLLSAPQSSKSLSLQQGKDG